MKTSVAFSDISNPERFTQKVTVNGISEHRLSIKLVHTGTSPFAVRHDLIQATYVNGVTLGPAVQCSVPTRTVPSSELPPGEEMAMAPGAMQGADVTYNGVVETNDIELFDTLFADEHAAADLNGDGIVKSDDLVQFVEAIAASSGNAQ